MTGIKTFFATAAVFAALVAGAVDWQFTGATNRSCAASAQTAAATLPLRIRTTGNPAAGSFESRLIDSEILYGCNFSSERVGLMLIVR